MWFVDLLLPRRCASCGCAADTLCVSCRSRVRFLRPPWCSRCGAPTAWPVERCLECSGRRLAFGSARAAVAYAGPVPALVRAWKERGLRHIAALAAELVGEHVARPAADVIAYIPPDHDRQLTRGHHPAERLARELARHWGLETAPLLGRARQATTRQAGLSLAERRRNARGAFTAVPGPPQRVLLVDDVYTTGATAAAAASALRAAGTSRIEVVTFARTVR